MSSMYERLIAAHRVVTREIGRERRKARPNEARLTRLEKERLLIKDRLFRQLPPSPGALRFVRAVLSRLRRAHA